MTNQEAENMLKQLAEHYGERVAKVSDYCHALDTWAKATAKYNGSAIQGAVSTVRFALMKSSLAARLVYGGEKLRTIECPQHKGRWSGVELTAADVCPHGCQKTGWLPAVSQ